MGFGVWGLGSGSIVSWFRGGGSRFRGGCEGERVGVEGVGSRGSRHRGMLTMSEGFLPVEHLIENNPNGPHVHLVHADPFAFDELRSDEMG
jgi:hypothetical protein